MQVCGDRMWPDGWTAVTADIVIIISAQFEHTLLVSAFFPS
ncbi:putative methionyl aminopeptidase [Lupinus albus]|uniref:Putative methionyl aminopeptidase n=1 Tax=Lupinus albus TaxID=3870 RepID=A0A6A4PNX6_LUPAL|nr:putative methionyl aminopeptidase [Lupinus albus]